MTVIHFIRYLHVQVLDNNIPPYTRAGTAIEIWPEVIISAKRLLENVSDETSVYSLVRAGRGGSVSSASAYFADGRGFDPLDRQNSFVEVGHEIISLPSADSSRAVVSYWRKNVH